jgi:hypothetical protein
METMDDKADRRARAIADLTMAAEHGGDQLEATARAAFVAGLEPFEIAELSGMDMARVWEVLGMPPPA